MVGIVEFGSLLMDELLFDYYINVIIEWVLEHLEYLEAHEYLNQFRE